VENDVLCLWRKMNDRSFENREKTLKKIKGMFGTRNDCTIKKNDYLLLGMGENEIE
jgi:hypothetical protein